MLRHIPVTTRTVLAVTTLTGLVAIAQAVTSQDSAVSLTELMRRPSTNNALESVAYAGMPPALGMQLAVMLEGFEPPPLIDAERSAASSIASNREEPPI
jgi:hypothetical protein